MCESPAYTQNYEEAIVIAGWLFIKICYEATVINE